ncbi:MAG: prolipoprotein diacylglyceryl transferase, partial [Clostridia bacterium]|nr:prolipoprotein diacylglyceryl transferase [Clostridia bacterium]
KLLRQEYMVSVQLFEALFLFALFGVLSYLVLKGKENVLPLYMISYGVWRFAIEFARGDDRGKTIISFLTPSQLVAILLVLGGVAFLTVLILQKKKKKE